MTRANLFKITPLLLLAGLVSVKQASSLKIDCHPLPGATKERCESLGCIWEPIKSGDSKVIHTPFNQTLPFDEATTKKLIAEDLPPKSDVGEAWCHFPEDYVGYKVIETNNSGSQIKIQRVRPSGLPNDIEELLVNIQKLGYDGNVLRVQIYDAKNHRFEPELPQIQVPRSFSVGESSMFESGVSQEGVLTISRKSNKAILFKTDLRKLIFSDKFIQLNSLLNSPFVYGLGEHYDTFLKLTNKYRTYSFFNYDRLPLPEGRRSYGGFPFYVNLDSDNKHAHGVYLRNSNAMDIVLQSDQSVTFRPIGGILDFIMFIGPEPVDVIRQYQNLVGLPDLPPRWALGFQLCRYNYGTLEKTKLVWRRTKESGIPFDVQWNDIDQMDRHNDFTYDRRNFAGLPQFIDDLHKINMHYMLLFDPGVSQEDNYFPYYLGKELDIFVKNSTNQTLVGKVWNDSGRTVFPDFSHVLAADYWSELFTKYQNEIKFDGAWIDMNDISNFVFGSIHGCPKNDSYETTIYQPGGMELQTHTLCLSAKHRAGAEYNVHNLYSFYEAIATQKALQVSRPGRRPFVISRSTAPGQGHYGGHWSGDVLSTWDYLRWSVPSLIEHSMYGFSMMGSDICGFVGNTTPELCARWSTLGAFYTFTRNHNDDVSIDQDPVALGPEVVEANRNALTMKYSLIPYVYSLIFRAHQFGEPVIRSIPFEFYTDKEALKVEYQFMWGRALMISPIVYQNTYKKSTYLPKGRWYETNIRPSKGDVEIPKLINSQGEWHETKDVALVDIPLFYRGGHIIPFYKDVKQTVYETVNQPIGLKVVLCSKRMAEGELYLDEGDNVDGMYNHMLMNFENNKLRVTMDHDEHAKSVQIGQIVIFGVEDKISSVRVKNKKVDFKQTGHALYFDAASEVFATQNMEVELS